MIVPRRASILRGWDAMDERLRFSLVTVGGRMPVEQRAKRYIGAVGEPGFLNGWVAAAGFEAPYFWKSMSGWLRLGGVARQNTHAKRTLRIFALPTQHRLPPEYVESIFLSRWWTSADELTIGAVAVSIQGEGQLGSVRPVEYHDPNAHTGARLVALDGLAFRVT